MRSWLVKRCGKVPNVSAAAVRARPLLLEEEVRICPISGLSTLQANVLGTCIPYLFAFVVVSQGACPFAKPKAKAVRAKHHRSTTKSEPRRPKTGARSRGPP